MTDSDEFAAQVTLDNAKVDLEGKTVVLVLSGGQDSTTCLYLAKHCGAKIHALTVNYGQRHYRELEAAVKVVGMAGVVSHEILQIPQVLQGTSPLVSDSELEQYADYHSLPGGIEKTFVPMRNALFLTLAANRAVVVGADFVVIGVSQEDYGGYPDCRAPFLTAFTQMVSEAIGEAAPDIYAPLLTLTKCQTVKLAALIPGCMEAMAFTHTSYDGQYPPVGHDHATLLRAKGFEEAGMPDPLVLRAVGEGLMTRPTTPNYDPLAV